MGKKTKIAVPTKPLRSARSVFFKSAPGQLVLKDGQIFTGQLFSQGPQAVGEVVFNTGMTGYVESLTDPSYANQILTFTYPLLGNYGVDPQAVESEKIQVSGVIISELATSAHHAKATNHLIGWFREQNIPLLTNVDTRALTKYLRSRGTILGAMGTKPSVPKKINKKFVSVNAPVTHNPGGKHKIILVDCGLKRNILQSLLDLDLIVKQVPHNYDYTPEHYDGVLLSNGPGDPQDYKAAIQIAKKAFQKNKPIFGICLGSQIMALAAGGKTYKLKFGHRGHNQPCLVANNGRAFITSQNHGYAIKEESLPRGWQVMMRNLNDGSVEGIEHQTKPFFSVQFHPEACPGPTDTRWLFERFHSCL